MKKDIAILAIDFRYHGKSCQYNNENEENEEKKEGLTKKQLINDTYNILKQLPPKNYIFCVNNIFF
jgi:hypothetical protein